MLSAFDRRWSARCGECLGTPPHEIELRFRDGTRDDAVRELAAVGWEIAENDMTWCLDCSRKRREVKMPTNARGVRRRRRTP